MYRVRPLGMEATCNDLPAFETIHMN
jgi:hypothetical protein